jgi:hypothetical protein
LLLAVQSCGKKDSQEGDVIFELTKPEETGINFVNTIPENDTMNQFNFFLLFNGNGVATGDLNNDGLPEVVFTGNEKPAALYLNKGDFKFEDITEKAGLKTSYWMGGISLADVNNDGFLDIYICRNGPDKIRDHKRNLLFINNGNLTFTEKAAEWGVDDPGNSTCASFFDLDNDGDLDLFVGGRIKPGYYTDVNLRSYLLKNNKGTFVDVTENFAPDLFQPGMVCAAVFCDYNNDEKMDLIVSGEFMPVVIMTNNGNKLVNQSIEAGTSLISGWYNSLMAVDIDNDSDLDLIAGNKGENSFFQATQDDNIKVFWSDLDQSGNTDFWLTYSKDHKDYPAYDLDEMATAFPMFVLKKFRTYSSFSGKTAQEVFGEENTKKSLMASQFNSLLLRNNGGTFGVEILPRLAQAGPLCGITAADVDGNGFLDIIGIGNNYAPRVEHGRDDALAGFVLYNNNGANFRFSHGTENGFYVDGDAKSLVWMDFPGKSFCFIATQNNSSAKAFRLTRDNMKFLPAPSKATRALVYLKNNGTRVENLSQGWGYLSASRPGVWTNKQVKSVQFLDALGNKL